MMLGGETSVDAAAERKLVHWVNSLPLASCLLIDDISDLRFGDVLWDIVCWIDRNKTSPSRGHIEDVVEFAARHCALLDQGIMHIIHSAQCASRLRKGDGATICAVVSVLMRICEERQFQAHVLEKGTRAQQRQEITRNLPVDNATTPVSTPAIYVTVARSKRSEQGMQPDKAREATVLKRPSQVHATQSTSSMICKKVPPRAKTAQVEYSLQNSIKQKKHASKHRQSPPNVTDKAREVMQWLCSLVSVRKNDGGTVDNDADAIAELKDGVVLCALAAVITHRRGSVAMRYKTHRVRVLGSSADVLFPRGATVTPRTVAEKKHNLKTAWSLMDECQVLSSSPSCSEDEFIRVFHDCGAESSVYDRVCAILSGARDAFTKSVTRAGMKTASGPRSPLKHPEATDKKTRRRPYITVEQIDGVKKWMKTIDVDPNAVATGIFQDTLRNGVALCQVIRRWKPATKDKPGMRGCPKTLNEVRENIVGAIQMIQQLRTLGLVLPKSFLASDVVDGIMMGDKQVIYGILWHLMQYWNDEQHGPPSVPAPEQQMLEVDQDFFLPVEPTKVMNAVSDRNLPQKVSMFELDVPACELLEGSVGSEELGVEASNMPTWWGGAHIAEDILPPPRASTRAVLLNSDDDEGDIRPRYQRKQATVSDAADPGMPVPAQITVRSPRMQVEATTSHHLPVLTAGDDEFEERDKETQTTLANETQSTATSLIPHGDIDAIVQWLKALGVEVSNTADLYHPAATLHDFKSGALFCSLVEKLEYMRVMEGVDRKPQVTRASALHNINKAASILEKKKGIPARLLRQKSKIYEGHHSTILELLLAMRKAYGYHLHGRTTGTQLPDVYDLDTLSPEPGAVRISQQ